MAYGGPADQLIRPIDVYLGNSRERMTAVCCPICDFDYVHPRGVEQSDDGNMTLRFECEHEQQFAITFSFMKGHTGVAVTGARGITRMSFRDGRWCRETNL